MGRGEPAAALRALSLSLGILAAATATDLLGARADLPALWAAGAHLVAAGVVVGTLATASLVASLRRGSKGRALRGAGLAGLALALFALTRWVRGDAAIPPDPAILLAEPLALGLLGLARWSVRSGRPSAGAELP